MISLTKQERLVLLIAASVVLAGSSLQYVFKKYPHLENMVNLMEDGGLYPKVDLNTASVEELVRVPYIGEYTARQIIDYRRQKGPFTSLEEVKLVRGIKEKNFVKFSSFLKITRHP